MCAVGASEQRAVAWMKIKKQMKQKDADAVLGLHAHFVPLLHDPYCIAHAIDSIPDCNLTPSHASNWGVCLPSSVLLPALTRAGQQTRDPFCEIRYSDVVVGMHDSLSMLKPAEELSVYLGH